MLQVCTSFPLFLSHNHIYTIPFIHFYKESHFNYEVISKLWFFFFWCKYRKMLALWPLRLIVVFFSYSTNHHAFPQFTVTLYSKGKINSYGRPCVRVTIHQLYWKSPRIVLAWQPVSWTQIRGGMWIEMVCFWEHDFCHFCSFAVSATLLYLQLMEVCECVSMRVGLGTQRSIAVFELYLHLFIWLILFFSAQKL